MRNQRSEFSTRELRFAELCIHESAHGLAGVVLGGRLRAASVTGLKTGGPFRALTTLDPMPLGHDPEVALAGPWSQLRWRHDRRPTQAELYRILEVNRHGDHAVLLAAGGTAAGSGVIPLLERCWGPICQLASKIATTTVVRHADVCAALGIPAKDNGHDLALIRGGAAPGSFTVTRPSVPA
ncbi:hypothetical protein [Mycobacterium interjectum]|uniref:hypothetical protein n=1 Tax=Mycobacterium interjectum TaxID=33895 RepID=UPI00082B2277|nr:hypothetical protein [Mycobacterium interjectum]MCV7090076.1 hypothetical protein [Mycobacterium interjectum]